MKKRHIFLGLALIASFSLTSCTKQESNTSSSETEVSAYKDRGSEDTGTETIDIPDVLKNNTNESDTYLVKHQLEQSDGSYETIYTETLTELVDGKTNAVAKEYTGFTPLAFEQQEFKNDGSTEVVIQYKLITYSVKLSNGDFGGCVAGEGEYSIYNKVASLVAKPYIGYDFVGWYDGDKLLSETKEYDIEITDDMNISAKFQVNDEFKCYEFESDLTTCTIKKFNNTYTKKYNAVFVPEGVTTILDSAFYESNVGFLTLPSTLKTVEANAFGYCNYLIKITDYSNAEFSRYAFNGVDTVIELYQFGNSNISVSRAVTYYSDEPTIIQIDANGFAFAKYDNNTLYLVGYLGTETKIVLPPSVSYKGKTYNSYIIRERSLTNRDFVSVVVTPAVSSILTYAFGECDSLFEVFNYSSLNITAGGYDHGEIAYYAKYVYTDYEATSKILSTDLYDFVLEEVDSKTVAKIVKYKGDMVNVNLPQVEYEGVKYDTYFNLNTFEYNSEIETLVIGDGVVEIANEAFAYCDNLKSITIEGNTSLGENTFKECLNLTTVEMPKVTEIGRYLFYGCNLLRNVDISSAISIGDYAFYNCASLYQITFPESLTTIDDYAFNGCIIGEIINKSSLSIEVNPSSNKLAVMSVVTSEADSNVETIDDFVVLHLVFGTYKYDYLLEYKGDDETVVIPDIISVIFPYALTNKNVKSLTLHNAMTGLGEQCFYHCSNVEKLQMPAAALSDTELKNFFITDNGDSAYLPKIKELILTDSSISTATTSIPSSFASGFDSIETVVIPKSVSKMGDYAFSDTTISTVYYDGSLDDWINITFNDESTPVSSTSDIYVTGETKDVTYNDKSYSEVTEYVIPAGTTEITDSQFKNLPITKVVIPASVTSIDSEAFAGCVKLKEVVFEEGSQLSNIGSSAFSYCTSLEEINLPSGVTQIGDYAFSSSGLIDITIPESVISFGAHVFEYCTSLKNAYIKANIETLSAQTFNKCLVLQSVELSDSITAIGESAFENCNVIKKIQFKDLISIEDKAFKDCTALRSLDISKTHITTIGADAFKDCRSIQTMVLPETLQELGSCAFEGCKSLTSVTLPDALTTIATGTFNDCVKLDFNEYGNCYHLGTAANPYKFLIDINSSAKSLTIHEDCYVIPKNLIQKAAKLDSVTIKSINISGDNLLYNVKTLSYLEVPYEVIESTSTKKLYSLFGAYSSSYQLIDKLVVTGTCTEIEEAFTYCNATEVILPSGVITIGYNAFYNSTKLESVYIPNTVETIGAYAFKQCTNLKTVEFEENSNLKTIGGSSFHTAGIEYITIPETVTEISGLAFAYSSIKEITIPASVSKLGSQTFGYTSNLDTVTIKEGNLTKIGNPTETFINSGIKTIYIPSTVKEIVGDAFKGCKYLYNVYNFSSYLTLTPGSEDNGYVAYYCDTIKTSLDEEAAVIFEYDNCTFVLENGNVTLLEYNDTTAYNVTLPETITYNNKEYSSYTIGKSAFENNTTIKYLTIPNSVTAICEKAFKSATNLVGVTFSEGSQLERIEANAFEGANLQETINLDVCTNLDTIDDYAFTTSSVNTITIPSSVTTLGVGVFKSCSNLGTVNFAANVDAITAELFRDCSSLYSFTFETSGINLIDDYAFYNTNISSFTIPNTVETIGEHAFDGCDNHSGSIVLADESTLKVIGDYAFSKSGVKEVTIPSTVTSFGQGVFMGASYLTYVRNESTMTVLPAETFKNCSKLATFYHGTYIEEYGDYAFAGCIQLQMTIRNCVKKIGSYAFADTINSSYTVYIDFESSAVIETIGSYAFYNSKISSLELPSTITSIGEYAFAGSNIGSITIPDSVTTLETYMFKGCEKLTKANLPSTLTEIKSSAFYNCSALTSITIPASVTSLGGYIFSGCTKLTTVTIPENAKFTEIKSGTFSNCKVLTSIFIPASVTSIGSYAFQNCYKLGTVTFEDNSNLTTIKTCAFEYAGNSASLELVLPESVTTLDEKALATCFATKIVVKGNVTSIGTKVFNGCAATEIDISGFTFIPSYAFNTCTSLTTVILGNKLTSIGSNCMFAVPKANVTIYNGENPSDLSSSYLSGTTIYTYSVTEPTESGNYWHYVDGVVTKWS